MFMEFVILLLCCIIMLGMASSAETEEWENPDIIGINKLSPHCTLMPFPSEETASTNAVSYTHLTLPTIYSV